MEQTAKRRNPYYSRNSPSTNKKPRKHALIPGLKGFLCSCNNREKECIRESYNILYKYAELLYGAEPSKENEPETHRGDIDDDFKREMEVLKREGERRFQHIDSGAKNFLFIQTTIDNPVELAHAIITDISMTKLEQTRFLLRLIPVEITCKAYIDDVKKAFESLAEKHFKEGAKSFSIVFNHRNNNSLSRDVVIREVADLISKQNSQHKVNLKNPEISVVVEVIRGVAFLAVVPDYFKFKKYNLHLVCQEDKEVGNGEDKVESKEVSKAEEVSKTEVESNEVSSGTEVESHEVSSRTEIESHEVSSTEIESTEVSNAEKVENKEEAK